MNTAITFVMWILGATTVVLTALAAREFTLGYTEEMDRQRTNRELRTIHNG